MKTSIKESVAIQIVAVIGWLWMKPRGKECVFPCPLKYSLEFVISLIDYNLRLTRLNFSVNCLHIRNI